MSWFVTWAAAFPRAAAQSKIGAYELLIAWMPILAGGAAIPFAKILRGDHDKYITQFLTSAEQYKYPVTIRFCHEMNLGTMPWSVGKGGPASVEEFRAVWRHIYEIKQRIGGSSVQLLWCISSVDGPIAAEKYFPGSEFVDKVGFDAYSGFTTAGWTAVADLLPPSYARLKHLAPIKPIWLCEVGCRETTAADSKRGRSKTEWMEDLFNLKGLSGLSHVVFFNKVKEQDWRLDSSPSVLQAVRAGLQNR